MKSYETMSEAVNDLQKRGYDHDFNLAEDSLECKEKQTSLKANDFEIDEVYRFEGDTDPGDENVVYAISSMKNNLKGILVNAYGVYSDSVSAELISKLHRHSDK
ncbi:MAG TPA: phosphoribosylpyrophosphate synthetase [Bacteroidia bacterium]|nr:phosphoribosylpyrophosphate synthetase [Bacteroidia bacterium]